MPDTYKVNVSQDVIQIYSYMLGKAGRYKNMIERDRLDYSQEYLRMFMVKQ